MLSTVVRILSSFSLIQSFINYIFIKGGQPDFNAKTTGSKHVWTPTLAAKSLVYLCKAQDPDQKPKIFAHQSYIESKAWSIAIPLARFLRGQRTFNAGKRVVRI